jgi:fatty acid desaturase
MLDPEGWSFKMQTANFRSDWVLGTQRVHGTSIANPWGAGNLKEELQGLRARFYNIPQVRDFVRGTRAQKRSGLDLLFAAATFFGGIALVLYGSNGALLIGGLGVIGIIAALTCVSSLTHESWHSSLSPSRDLNDFLSRWILSPLLFADFDAQRQKHLLHHIHLGEDDDPEGPLYRMATSDFLWMLMSRACVLPTLFRILTSKKTDNNATPSLVSLAGLLRIGLIQGSWAVIIIAGSWIWHGSLISVGLALAFGYLLPLMLASFMVAVRGHREHYVDQATAKTITCDTNCVVVERWLVAGGAFNWHVCHHLFPEIPQRHLSRFARLLREHGMGSCYDTPNSPIAARRSYLSSTPELRQQTPCPS